jgi:two-component sensor histidine kinase
LGGEATHEIRAGDNLKIAKELGLTGSHDFLLVADHSLDSGCHFDCAMAPTKNHAGAAEPEAPPPKRKDEPFLTRALARLIRDVPPFSGRAFFISFICLLAAVDAQLLFRWAGSSLQFATYYPAVLVAGLIAGVPGGLFVTVAALLTVWWSSLLPYFSSSPLDSPRKLDLFLFVLSSGCILLVTHSYRAALQRLRRQERERQIIMKELEHRGRNTYAVIDAIVQKTLEDQPERANIISGRIRAVKFANDLLSQTDTHTILLKTLLLHEFFPYGEARFQAQGADVELAPDNARHLALVFHELVTNAAKYGALSNPRGRVLISWKKTDAEVSLEWREEGGPPVVPPVVHGFGSRIVTQSLRSVSGSIVPTFAPEGLHCAITFRA